MTEQANSVVHPFETTIGDPPPDPAQDAIEVVADHPRHFLDRLDLRVHGAVQPPLEEAPRPAFAVVGVEVHEVVLEQHRPVELAVGADLLFEHLLVFRGPTLRGFQHRKAGVAQIAPGLGIGVASKLPADLGDRVVEMAHDVEAVENDARLRCLLAQHDQVRLPHVGADRLELSRSLRPQASEEAQQGLDLAVLARPHDPAAEVVDDHGEVLVVPTVADLVHPDHPQAVEVAIAVPLALDHPVDDVAHGGPGEAEVLGHGGEIAALSQPGDLLLEGAGESAAVLGPRDLFGAHAAAWAADAPDAVAQNRLQPQDVEVAPGPPGAIVSGSDFAATAAATTDPPAGLHQEPDFPALGDPLQAANPEPLNGEQLVQ